MKSIGTVSATAIFLLLGLSAPAFALQGQEEKPKNQEVAKPEEKPQEKPQAKPQEKHATQPKQEQQAKPQQEKAKPQQDQSQKQAAKPEKQQQQNIQQQAKGKQEQQQAKSINQQPGTKSTKQQAGSLQRPQRSKEEVATQHGQPSLHLSPRGSGRIPDDHFRSSFGRDHEFRMGNPVMVSGYSRFQYGGYWFGYVQPWPAGWYYSDQFYIDYVDGGYYMYDPYYPGARFAITVVL